MHELTLIDDLMRTAETEADRVAPQGRFVSLTIRIGALSCASAEALHTSFDMLKPGTRMANAELVIEELPVRLECNACGAVSETPTPEAQCPKCGSPDIRVDGETWVELHSIDLDTED